MSDPKREHFQTFKNLYVHFPYCETKCHYCDFFSLPESKTSEPDRANVYGAILMERDFFKLDALDTVFFGGGTPSLVPLNILESLISKLPVTQSTEFTMEANPSSITLEKARAWAAMGIRRISMGVQALDDNRLKWLSRVHDVSEVMHALDALFTAGIPAVSIDYITGVPEQSLQDIEDEISDVLKRFPMIRHMSAYLLTLKNSNAKFSDLPDEEIQLSHLRHMRSVLSSYGFDQYEISNFAAPGHEARHNINYWLGGGYLGIGPSAHSYFDQHKRRAKNWASLGKYQDLVAQGTEPFEWEETVTLEQERIETIMLRLRRREGLDLDEYRKKYSQDLLSERRNLIRQMSDQNLCKVEGHRLRLTADGFFLSDQVIAKLV